MERVLADNEIIQDGDWWLEEDGKRSLITGHWIGKQAVCITNRWTRSKVIRADGNVFDDLLEKLAQIRRELWMNDY